MSPYPKITKKATAVFKQNVVVNKVASVFFVVVRISMQYWHLFFKIKKKTVEIC